MLAWQSKSRAASSAVLVVYIMNDPSINSSWVGAEPGWEAWRVAGDQLRGGGDAAPDRIQAQCAQTPGGFRYAEPGLEMSDLICPDREGF